MKESSVIEDHREIRNILLQCLQAKKVDKDDVQNRYISVQHLQKHLIELMLDGNNLLNSEVLDNLPPVTLAESNSVTKLKLDSLLSEVFDFIEANYSRPITLRDVAKAVGYSPAYLTDRIRRQTGQTVNRWIIRRRLAAARCLLLKTNQPIAQIAEAVGYQNIEYFYRQFRQLHQMSPHAWRQENRSWERTPQHE